MLVVVTRAAADVHLAPGTLTGAQQLVLAGGPAYSTGHVSTDTRSAGHLSTGSARAGQIPADGAAAGTLICTRDPAAGVWVLPGTPLPEPRHDQHQYGHPDPAPGSRLRLEAGFNELETA